MEEINFSSPENWTYLCLVFVLIYAIKSLLFGRILQKAGEKTWKAWVPFINIWTWFKIAGYRGCITLILVLSLIAYMAGFMVTDGNIQSILFVVGAVSFITFFVCAVAAGISIQKKLNKPAPFIILMFINLIAPLWMWILALDYSKWNNKKGHKLKKKSKK